MKLRFPDAVRLFTAIDRGHEYFGRDRICFDDAEVSFARVGEALRVSVKADRTPVFYLRLRWNFTESERRHGIRVFGDTWERTYGELEWRGIVPQRFMPWYMLVSDGDDLESDASGRLTEGFGVGVRPGAFCAWQYDTCGITLWADVRCGGDGVLLGGRCLDVCDIYFAEYRDMSAFAAGRKFCSLMCPSPLLPDHTVYGSNNWYYAVGNSSHEKIVTDARLISSLARDLSPRPYMVIDDGWQVNSCDGPFDRGNERFPDMARLAHSIEREGAVPGIWIRPLADAHGQYPELCHTAPRPSALDPSTPEVLDYVGEMIGRIVKWGYRLIKHDFTFYDMFGTYGAQRTTHITDNSWSFHDRTRTSAEIAISLYEKILESAGDAILIACNTPSHLTAGLAHLYRTGNDTSGRYHERTRICGVNALSHRMIQNGTFYLCDADCCSHTGRIPWEINSEWLRALSESGTPLFLSLDPECTGEREQRDIRAALRRAIEDPSPDQAQPLDWMDCSAPEVYSINGERHTYRWYAYDGTEHFIPPDHPEY